MISYAGIDLLEPTDSIREWIKRQNDPAHLWQFGERQWPGRNLTHLPFRGPKPEQDIEFNILWWPTTACRFSCFHGVVDQGLLDAIRAIVYPSDDPNLYAPATLVLDDGYASVTASMLMLPATPLQEIGDGYYLLTLVDERYFWWIQAAAIEVEEGVTTWEDLYEAIADALGITITVDAIEPAYLSPPASFGTSYEALPLLLDAVAYCTGRRIVRQLDGTVRAWNPVNSKTQQDAALEETADNVAQLAYSLSTSGLDNTPLLPESVTLVFPRTDSGSPSVIPHVEPVTLASLALADFTGLVGFDGSKVFKASPIAAYPGPSNAVELAALAEQFATDWYRWQVGKAALSRIGYPGWVLTGLDDALECRHESGQVWTRILRGEFNDTREELGYLGAAGSTGPPPDGGFNLTVEGVPDGAVVLNVFDIQFVTPKFIVTEVSPGVALIDLPCKTVRPITGPPPWTHPDPEDERCCNEDFTDGVYYGIWNCALNVFRYYCPCLPDHPGSGSGGAICLCTQCLTGAPDSWFIPTPNARGDFADLGDSVTVSWDSDCTWTALKGDVSVTLEYVGPYWRLYFLNVVTLSYDTFRNYDPFRCCGENIFTTTGEFTGGDAGLVDDELVLSPASVCTPCGSGSGSGPSCGVCPGVELAETLYATFTTTPTSPPTNPACNPVDGLVVELTWNGVYWEGHYTLCGKGATLALRCGLVSFEFTNTPDAVDGCGWSFGPNGTSSSCTPFLQTYDGTLDSSCCFACTFSVAVTE